MKLLRTIALGLAAALAVASLCLPSYALTPNARLILFADYDRPTLDLDFRAMTALPSQISFTRTTAETCFDSTGTLQNLSSGVPCLAYDPSTGKALGLQVYEQRTNSIRNNTMQGASAPSTAPTNWSLTALGGISPSVVGTGTEDGIDYIDIRWNGTTSSTANAGVAFEATTQTAALQNQTWTSSLYLRLVGGSLSNIASFILRNQEFDSGGSNLAQNANTMTNPTSAALRTQRQSFANTLSNASTAFTRAQLVISPTASGVATDLTIRVGLPQTEQGAFVTPVIKTTNAAATRNTPIATVSALEPWYNPYEGTFYIEAMWQVAGGVVATAMSANGGGSYVISSRRTGADTTAQMTVTDGGVSQVGLTLTSSYSAGSFSKVAVAYRANDFNMAANGALAAGDTAGTVPAPGNITQMVIGSGVAGGNPWNGYIGRATYRAKRLYPDVKLRQKTSANDEFFLKVA